MSRLRWFARVTVAGSLALGTLACDSASDGFVNGPTQTATGGTWAGGNGGGGPYGTGGVPPTGTGGSPGTGGTTGTPVVGVPVIFETDMTVDIDDVGALGVLHGLQNEGKATILAVTYNEVHANAAEAIDAINTYYNRGTIPIGLYGGSLDNPDGDWSGYLGVLAGMNRNAGDNTVDTALNVYKQVLAAQPDNSVVIISVGFFNNLHDLLQDPEGFNLVQSKVSLLAVMGGQHDDGFNFVRHNLTNTTQYVFENWPGTVVGTDVGGDMYTGETLDETTPANNPVRRTFEVAGRAGNGRESWDEVTTLYAVLGTQFFTEDWSSGGSLPNGYSWSFTQSYPARGWADPINDGVVEAEIERLMTLPPI